MGDQKNLILAIVISVAIIFIFQILFPVQTPTITSSENIEEIQPAASIDETQIITKNVITPAIREIAIGFLKKSIYIYLL